MGKLIIFATAILLVTSAAAQSAKSAGSPARGKTIFAANCATCHGADGAGTAMGHSMGVIDLRSAEVHQMSAAELEKIVSNGKGSMPAWRGQLSPAQIKDAVAFVRTLGAKKH